MSVLNISPSNFQSGPVCIATNVYTESELQDYIDKYEEEILIDLLGCDLYNLFVADLVSGVPQTQIYLDIYNKFCIDEDYCHIWKSEGMVKMLEYMIFFYYVRDQKVKQSNEGNVVSMAEASRESTFTESNIYRNYNQGIKSYCAIQWYICDNSNDYPDFNGQIKKKTTWL